MSSLPLMPLPIAPARAHPAEPRYDGRSFWQVMQVTSKVGLACHVFFMGLFLHLGMPGMVWINVFSTVLYGGVIALFQYRHSVAAIRLLQVEMTVHAVVAVRLVGWESGFHYQVLVMVSLIFVSSARGPAGKAMLRVVGVIGAIAAYLALDAYAHSHSATYAASASLLNALRWFNAGTALMLLGVLSHVLLATVQQAEERLQAMRSTDVLTGALNRRTLLDAGAWWASSVPASVLFCDIDHFKRISDVHGHPGGDEVLACVSRAIQDAVRPGDLVGRWGRGEFVVLLPGADTWVAAAVAERIRAGVLALVVMRGAHAIAVSMTIGVATRHGDEPIEGCISRADGARRDGKVEGRNRVVCAV